MMGWVTNRKGIFSWRLQRRADRIRITEDWFDRRYRPNSRWPEAFVFFDRCDVAFERADIRGASVNGAFVSPTPVRIYGRWMPRRNAHHFAWKITPRARRAWTSRERAANSLNNRVLYPHLPF